MAHYRVNWHRGKINASSWYTQGAVVVHASPCLRRWIGRRHAELVIMLNSQRGWPDRKITRVSNACHPTTKNYLRELTTTVNALVALLETKGEQE